MERQTVDSYILLHVRRRGGPWHKSQSAFPNLPPHNMSPHQSIRFLACSTPSAENTAPSKQNTHLCTHPQVQSATDAGAGQRKQNTECSGEHSICTCSCCSTIRPGTCTPAPGLQRDPEEHEKHLDEAEPGDVLSSGYTPLYLVGAGTKCTAPKE